MIFALLKYFLIAICTFTFFYLLETDEVGTLIMTVLVPLTVYVCSIS